MSGAIYIAGPTASGKSEVALLVAERLNGEIISVDSMQVYRGMDIGTAKPSAEERRRVPHHLIDIVEPRESFDVARFLQLARKAEEEIRGRGRRPIFCGGTGLYFKALVAGIGGSPAASAQVRAEIEQIPLATLLEELERSDPETFARIDKSNPRRVMRAVEVIRTTGQKYSSQRADWTALNQSGRWFGLQRERSDLISRLEARVEIMFAHGLVDETRKLLEKGLEENRTASQALGYRQVIEHLHGEHSLAETKELVKQKTRQYAKRQMTWFRHQLALEWLPVTNESKAAEIAERIWKRLLP